ncbi:hypothetical protein AB6A40_005365 [Gnathostoma spinigerum]|uniref:Uncharacterized protein n=1 Tax=Gnathostoma spinigerum TaxID=75299 RepID=A0ABD6EMK2_9BILA
MNPIDILRNVHLLLLPVFFTKCLSVLSGISSSGDVIDFCCSPTCCCSVCLKSVCLDTSKQRKECLCFNSSSLTCVSLVDQNTESPSISLVNPTSLIEPLPSLIYPDLVNGVLPFWNGVRCEPFCSPTKSLHRNQLPQVHAGKSSTASRGFSPLTSSKHSTFSPSFLHNSSSNCDPHDLRCKNWIELLISQSSGSRAPLCCENDLCNDRQCCCCRSVKCCGQPMCNRHECCAERVTATTSSFSNILSLFAVPFPVAIILCVILIVMIVISLVLCIVCFLPLCTALPLNRSRRAINRRNLAESREQLDAIRTETTHTSDQPNVVRSSAYVHTINDDHFGERRGRY